MNIKDQIKAVAELDGWKLNEFNRQVPPNLHPLNNANCDYQFPPYLTSRDAIVPVIEKIIESYGNQLSFYTSLQRLVIKQTDNPYSIEFSCITATPQQLCEALLRTTGKWKD